MTQTAPRPPSASFFPSLRGDLPTIVRAEGIYLYDDDGRAFIDAAGGVGCVTSVGHAVPEVVDAISEQMHAVAFLPWTQFQSKPTADLADLIASISPGTLTSKARDRKGSPLYVSCPQLAVASLLRHCPKFLADVADALAINITDHRHDQVLPACRPPLRCDSTA